MLSRAEARDSLIPHQKAYFNANCMIRGSRDCRICPKNALFCAALGVTGRKLLVTL